MCTLLTKDLENSGKVTLELGFYHPLKTRYGSLELSHNLDVGCHILDVGWDRNDEVWDLENLHYLNSSCTIARGMDRSGSHQ